MFPLPSLVCIKGRLEAGYVLVLKQNSIPSIRGTGHSLWSSAGVAMSENYFIFLEQDLLLGF